MSVTYFLLILDIFLLLQCATAAVWLGPLPLILCDFTTKVLADEGAGEGASLLLIPKQPVGSYPQLAPGLLCSWSMPWRHNPTFLPAPTWTLVLKCSAITRIALTGRCLHLPRIGSLRQCPKQTRLQGWWEYFQRWVQKWPTVQALAAASLDEVNEAWAGLGYYRRARFLLEGAQNIAARPDGQMPRTAQEWLKIPGVGAYTSRSVASIGCQEAVAAVDANVVRVLSRLRRCSLPGIGPGAATYQELASQVLDPERPGDFNQAMMELGACICTKGPEPSVLEYPVKAKKAQRRDETWAVCVVEVPGGATSNTSRLLMSKRPASGLLAGLWEFPAVILPEGCSTAARSAAVNSCLEDCWQRLGCEQDILGTASRKQLGTVKHVFSHINMTLVVEHLIVQDDHLIASLEIPDDCHDLRWMHDNQLDGSKLSSSVQKVVQMWKTRPAEVGSLKDMWGKHHGSVPCLLERKGNAGEAEAKESLEETNQAISRITSGDLKREGFGLSSDNWISETNFDFFTRGGPTERGFTAPAPEDQGVVRRRLLIGIAAAAVLGGLSLIPSDTLREKPPRPLFQYLAPLLRIQGLLADADTIVNNGEWEQLSILLDRVQNQPNFMKTNLKSAIGGLETRERREQAEALSSSIREYVDQIDSNKYYDAMGKPGQRGGEREAQLVKFSSNSLKAAQDKMKAFIKLFPRDDVSAAQQQLDQVYL
ncbi:hypothetical protein WJX84_004795 [Apatococcus fuscideae]|uniref:Adenine DNA glycosylase n=1 Tax=Apatococcus fuscideae TaxID=2026836 RepID=A0AAW1T7S4_9CHLO